MHAHPHIASAPCPLHFNCRSEFMIQDVPPDPCSAKFHQTFPSKRCPILGVLGSRHIDHLPAIHLFLRLILFSDTRNNLYGLDERSQKPFGKFKGRPTLSQLCKEFCRNCKVYFAVRLWCILFANILFLNLRFCRMYPVHRMPRGTPGCDYCFIGPFFENTQSY